MQKKSYFYAKSCISMQKAVFLNNQLTVSIKIAFAWFLPWTSLSSFFSSKTETYVHTFVHEHVSYYMKYNVTKVWGCHWYDNDFMGDDFGNPGDPHWLKVFSSVNSQINP